MERLIVDGYNLLHAHPVYGRMIADDFDGARARLVSDLAGFAHGSMRVVVVFDGGGNPDSDGAPHHLGQLTVIFSPAGSTADTVIEALAARCRARGERATVVTSDTATRDATAAGTIAVRSASSFLEELGVEAAERSAAGSTGSGRVVVADRVESGVGAVLARWARGHAPGHSAR